mmetsp:Transcript_31586/g.86374  ORF Transcript_31586/g.86374 Transcript_31586/m.86374 type:complete len:275 (-) Transcript_31586:311-1135(-)
MRGTSSRSAFQISKSATGSVSNRFVSSTMTTTLFSTYATVFLPPPIAQARLSFIWSSERSTRASRTASTREQHKKTLALSGLFTSTAAPLTSLRLDEVRDDERRRRSDADKDFTSDAAAFFGTCNSPNTLVLFTTSRYDSRQIEILCFWTFFNFELFLPVIRPRKVAKVLEDPVCCIAIPSFHLMLRPVALAIRSTSSFIDATVALSPPCESKKTAWYLFARSKRWQAVWRSERSSPRVLYNNSRPLGLFAPISSSRLSKYLSAASKSNPPLLI